MADFPSTVNAPGGMSYAAPLVNFGTLGGLSDDYQQAQLNKQKLAQNQQNLDLSKVFAGGIPTDAQGNPDYKAMTALLAQKGDISAISQLAPYVQFQQSSQPDPMLAGMGGAPAASLPPGNAATLATHAGGDAAGSLVDLVTGKLPQDNPQTASLIAKIAATMQVDPNAPLTPGQQRRATGLIDRYAQSSAGSGSPGAAVSAPTSPATSANARISGDFTALPPSAGAVTPAPQRQPQPTGGVGTNMPPGGPGVVPQGGAPQPQPQPQTPQSQPQQPLVPQVPLPQGFNDPQKAILALNREAALIAGNKPQQAAMLKDWAARIESSTAPKLVGQSDSFVDPRTNKIIFQGPLAAQFGKGEDSPALDADAERYRQTGTLPPNMGRGIQGQQLAATIRARAVEQETKSGGDPAQWPERWAQFKTQGGYTGQVDSLVKGVKSGDLPPDAVPAKLRGPVDAALTDDGFSLTKATLEWKQAQKQMQALNAPQMTRFVGLANSVTNTMDEVKEISEQMKLSGVPLYNRAKISTYIQAEGNSEKGQLAARYIGAVNTLKEEFANLANGGYAPIGAAWTLANEQINGDYGVKELGASLNEVQRLIKIRVNSIPGLSDLGPGSANRYTGASGAPAAPAPLPAASSTPSVVQWIRRPDGTLGPAQ